MTDSLAQPTAVTAPELTERVPIDPALGPDAWRREVPARPACYLLEDHEHRPLLLATVGDLRAALLRRLAPAEEDQPRKRIDYRAVVRHVRYRPVHSRFEAHWTYLENVRGLFPESYPRLIRNWRAHWIGVDLNAAHPRFVAADRPLAPIATCFGPLPDGRTARRFVEMLEDLFDLCRYHHILTQAPHGTACAYKDMDRCPAPCDGSISMDAYRDQLRHAVEFLHRPHGRRTEPLTQSIKQAAAELDFEHAQRLKTQLKRAELADGPEAAHLRPLPAFAHLALQPGSRKRALRAFAIGPGSIELLGEIPPDQRHAAAEPLARRMAERVEGSTNADAASHAGHPDPIRDPEAAERLGLVAWHLFNADRDQGRFLPAEAATDPAAVGRAIEQLTDSDRSTTTGRTKQAGTAPVDELASDESGST